MKKPIFLRFIFITSLYVGIFILLVSTQFASPRGFVIAVGDFIISGQHRLSGENESLYHKYHLDGNVQIIFGGIGFDIAIGNGDRSLHVVETNGDRVQALPESMIISENTAQFVFNGGTELVFASHYVGGFPEIRIAAVFAEGISGIELPFTPQRRTRIMDTVNGQFVAVSAGVYHSFGNSPVDIERRVLHVYAGGRPVSFRAIPEGRIFSPYDFILTQAETTEAYSQFITQWRENNFPRWNNAALNINNEDIVLANVTEALVRGAYRAAVSAVPASFMGGNARTYQSSVFLGGMDQAHTSLLASDREKLSSISMQINNGSAGFLAAPHVFEFLSGRGQNNFIDAALNVVRAMNPNMLHIDLVPGILEGYAAFRTLRPGTENPFEPLINQAFHIISSSLRRIPNMSNPHDNIEFLVFAVYDGQREVEFNLRLGKALTAHAERGQIEAWAEVGRSLVLSALLAGETSDPELSARLYNILRPAGIYPRAVQLSSPAIWTWTASEVVNVVQQNDILDIQVSFTPGESHYMIIRGIRPFVRIQIHNMDWRSDPGFERFDSSGWRYIPQEQTLLVKMRHRTSLENLRIIFWEPPAPSSPASVSVQDDTANSGAGTITVSQG